MFKKVFMGNSLIDIWLNLRLGDIGYIWCNGENVFKSCIDYVFVLDFYVY